MPVDPQIAAILPMLAGAPPLSSGTPEAARAGFRLFTVDLRDPAILAPVRSTEDVTFPGADGPRAARIYRPELDGPVPTILFVHGGGYVIGDIDTHEPSTGERKRTPCSSILRSLARLKTWKPPESVRMGRRQPMKPCRPSWCRATVSAPGRNIR